MLWSRAIGAGGVGSKGISFVGQATATSGSLSGDVSVANLTALSGGTESSPKAGDFVIALIYLTSSDDSAKGRGSIATSGYTTLLGPTLVGNGILDAFITIGYKFMGATPDLELRAAAPTGQNSSEVLQARVYRGVNKLSPINVSPVTSSAKPINPPSISPSVGAWVIAGGGVSAFGQTSSAAISSPDLGAFYSGTIIAPDYDSIAGWGHSETVFNPGAFVEASMSTLYEARAACTFSINPD